MSKAIEYINKSYMQNISLEEICSYVHMSKYYFCRKFKETMGITVMEYILKTRIAAAKNLLVSDKMTISETSEKCGFSSVSYFCQAFRQGMGMNANKYRKMTKNTNSM